VYQALYRWLNISSLKCAVLRPSPLHYDANSLVFAGTLIEKANETKHLWAVGSNKTTKE
jgi:hypothetical protein